MENLKLPKTHHPLEKNSITPPDKVFSSPPPYVIVISLKNFNLLQKKTQPTP